MFYVNALQAAAIRRARDVGGDLSAVVEFRVQFPGMILDDQTAMVCARTIAA
jgi:hypothetical protein